MLSFVFAAHGQFQLGFNYMFSTPIGTLGENIQPVNSFAMSGAANLKANKHFFLGGELSFGLTLTPNKADIYFSKRWLSYFHGC
jgi:hypothetical protein